MKASTLLALAALALAGPTLNSTLTADESAVRSLDRIAPFIDEFTVTVARLDVTALQPQAWADAILDALPQQRSILDGPTAQVAQVVQGWLDGFRAAGGTEVYLIGSMSYLGMEPPALLVVPLADAADANRLQALMGEVAKPWRAECRMLDGCVVAAPASVWRTREANGAPASLSANLRSALASAPPGVFQAVNLLYPQADRILREAMPALPQALGGGSSEVLTRGARWITLSLQAPPRTVLRMVVQSESAADATALQQVLVRGLTLVGQDEALRRDVPAWDEILTLITPKVNGDALEVRLDQAQITSLARQMAVPLVQESRDKAQRIELMNNLKQIALAMHLNAGDHQDQFPPHLADALPQMGSAKLLVVPGSSVQPPDDLLQQDRAAQVAWIDQHTDLVFALPNASLKSLKDPARTPLVYQKAEGSTNGFVGVAFADGHVEILQTEALAELLK